MTKGERPGEKQNGGIIEKGRRQAADSELWLKDMHKDSSSN
ncbi:hypothetical protein M5D96_004857 [Drosophila gunungcola]|uniref:Uncharacterized protein n=1 Tax=Drosophila gunungcola TaxID=103775 RepID=A0A9P9YUS3_9MUSC|nr:hypothetical protein M5D96_004857 [Drosophila gunungcola]